MSYRQMVWTSRRVGLDSPAVLRVFRVSRVESREPIVERNASGSVTECRTPLADKKMSVKHAIALKRIKIVTYDWLEDSLLAGRRKREKTYLWEEIEKERRREARRARKLEKDRKRGEKEGRSFFGLRFWWWWWRIMAG